MPTLSGAEEFRADGGPVGVVLSHGFTGTPASMRPWARHLADAGHAVRVPLLPGHGTSWRDLANTAWPQWYDAVEQAYLELAGQCAHVFAAGLSMGGTLVTRLAERQPVAGLVLVNPSFGTTRPGARFARVIAPLAPSVAGLGGDVKKPGASEHGYARTPLRAFASLRQLWAVTLADLPRVTAPILAYRSRVDHVVEPLSGRLLRERATATHVREVILENSYHVATLDHEAPMIFAGSVEFIDEVLGGGR